MTRTEKRIRAAITEAKTLVNPSQKQLNEIAQKHDIQGLLETNRAEGHITGWTARLRVVA